MDMDQRKSSTKKWLIIASVLFVLSMAGSSLVQSSGGKVTIKDLRWETSLGRQMSALLLIPDSATPSNPAPAIVTSHGWYNNREMQDLNYVEYARRGYVVMSIDMYGHGNSDFFSGNGWNEHGTGMYDAVQLMATLPYVNKSKIGITGHSNGARACNLSVDDDNKAAVPLIAAVLLVANDATYRNPDTNEYWNKYGSRDTGIIAAKYDEFFFRREFADGTVSVPRTYIGTMDAQSFLNFGQDPYKTNLEKRTEGTFYTQNVNGRNTIRVIYTPNQIHPWNHFSKVCVEDGIAFFDKAFGAPKLISPGNQIWQIKTIFNLFGVAAFGIFIVAFTILMTFTPVFASLRAPETVQPAPAPKGQGAIWFWGGLAVSVIFSMIIYFPSLVWASQYKPSIFWQAPPLGIGIWAFLCGLLSIIIMVVSYKLYGKKNGQDAASLGVKISLPALGKTLLLALITITVTYGWVFIADFFFKTDYRFWVLAIKAFTADKLIILLPYLPLFLTYYIANSISVNCFNYNGIGKKEWVNTAILAVSNALGPAILVLIQYITFAIKGEMFFARPASPMGPIGGIWLFPIIVILPVAAIISRKIYRVTKNPYLAGIINGVLVVIISCTNTLTIIP
ncbi:alpha/beta hydrolase family protein [Breznakiella homolactica]|uniref:Xaa-Pro dipeptidyl-peptidase-like domain-containing protein n=1 Tax=Breznakiella homolactica TaxID=2798577 RepID=A0A7T7XLD3_9SPIR|nr:CocE/NonD family hydrolase [Breznakiella homolactica]QQO08426.1 acetylxylan esterase [Breznakiella homolactica]